MIVESPKLALRVHIDIVASDGAIMMLAAAGRLRHRLENRFLHLAVQHLSRPLAGKDSCTGVGLSEVFAELDVQIRLGPRSASV